MWAVVGLSRGWKLVLATICRIQGEFFVGSRNRGILVGHLKAHYSCTRAENVGSTVEPGINRFDRQAPGSLHS
jgi:hypothetical protein